MKLLNRPNFKNLFILLFINLYIYLMEKLILNTQKINISSIKNSIIYTRCMS